jgi:hypothetical protein
VNKFAPQFIMHNDAANAVRKVIPFASFTTESMRVYKNVLQEKPHLAFFWNHVFETASETLGAMAGFNPREIAEAKEGLPHHMQGKKMLLFPFNVDGQARFIDASYLVPMANIVETQDTEKMFFNEVMDFTTNPFINVVATAATGRDPFSGREVEPRFTERQAGIPVTGKQTRKIVGLAEHMTQMMLPPLAPPGYAGLNILEMLRGQKNPATQEDLENGVYRTILANVFGVRMHAPDVESQVLNLKKVQRDLGKRMTWSWKRWEWARAQGKLDVMEKEKQRIKLLRRAMGHADEDDYFAGSIKRRDTFSNLSTKQLKAALDRAYAMGNLTPKDERMRAELIARLNSRTNK